MSTYLAISGATQNNKVQRGGGGGGPRSCSSHSDRSDSHRLHRLLGLRPPPGLEDKEGCPGSWGREREAKESWDPIPAPESTSRGSEGEGQQTEAKKGSVALDN